MADRWMDDRDRDWRDRDWRRSEAYGRGGEARRSGGSSRWGEDRTWSASDEEGEPYEERARHDLNYGEEEGDYGGRSQVASGGGYGGAESYGRSQGYRGQSYRDQSYRDQRGARTQPPRFSSQDYTGRSYADDSGRADYGHPSRSTYGGQGHGEETYTGQGGDAGIGYGPLRAYGGGRPAWQGERERRYDRDFERRRGEHDDRSRERWERDNDRGEGAGDFLQRAGERISSWFRGDNLMRGSREEEQNRRYREDFGREARPVDPGHRGRGPKGYQRPDARISDEVHDRLTDDPWLDASDIQVEVKNGEVTLSGHVDNREAKHRAERLIEDLSGVRHVQNNLRVDPNAGLTGAGRGFGSSALEAEMRRNEQATDPASGLSGRSAGAGAERSTGAATGTSVDPKTGAKRN